MGENGDCFAADHGRAEADAFRIPDAGIILSEKTVRCIKKDPFPINRQSVVDIYPFHCFACCLPYAEQ